MSSRHDRTIDPCTAIKPEVRELPAYTLDQVDCRFKLDQNEVPWDLPSRLKKEAAARLLRRNWAHYPDFHSERLRELVAARHGWDRAGVLVGNGSNELLLVTLLALVGEGREVLGIEPTFGLYESFIRAAGGTPHFLAPRQDLQLQTGELLEEVRREPQRPLLLCSPNNPTGAAAHPDVIRELLESIEAPLLLDNAYGEFCAHDYRPLLHEFRHLVLFRTFSKAWSLGGVRLGFLLADPRFVAELIKVKLPYNVGHASACIGEVVLENPKASERSVVVLKRRRAQWTQRLQARGFEVFPSEGNFLLVRTAEPERLRAALADAGILVRKVAHYPGLEGCVRFAVGSGAALRATEEVLDSLGRAMASAKEPDATKEASR